MSVAYDVAYCITRAEANEAEARMWRERGAIWWAGVHLRIAQTWRDRAERAA